MGLNYGWEKSYRAVRHLAMSDDLLADRLADVWEPLTRLEPERDLPEDAHDFYRRIMDAYGDVGPARDVVARLDHDTLTKLADDIVSLYNSAAEAYYSEK